MIPMITLDQWGVFNKDSEMEIPLIISDAHADYLYEQSHERQIEKTYQFWIDEKLAEEREEKERHEDYCEKNYIRISKTKKQ